MDVLKTEDLLDYDSWPDQNISFSFTSHEKHTQLKFENELANPV